MATGAGLELVNKFGGRSDIWKYFGFEPNEEGEPKNPDAPVCKKCLKTCTAKAGNTSNLINVKHRSTPRTPRD